MTGMDILEVALALLIGGRCALEGIFYKKTARKSLRVLKMEYRYAMWGLRAFYILLGLLPMLLGVMLATVVSIHSP